MVVKEFAIDKIAFVPVDFPDEFSVTLTHPDIVEVLLENIPYLVSLFPVVVVTADVEISEMIYSGMKRIQPALRNVIK